MEKVIVTRNQMINELLKIGHRKPDIYTETGMKAVETEPELFAHMIAWNNKHGQVRSSKVALPVIALRGTPDMEWYENAVAHMCLLDPGNFLNAIRYNKKLINKGLQVGEGAGKLVKYALRTYLRARERHTRWWDASAVQHRESMKVLYTYAHIVPSARASIVLFREWPDEKKRRPRPPYPKGSVFEAIANLKNMTPQEAAGTVMNFRIPYNIAVSIVPDIKNPDIVLALMERMSGAELITNTNMLKNLGVFESPVLKVAYEEAMERTKKDKRVSTLKAGHAADIVEDKTAKKKLQKIQEDQLETLSKIEGDWIILGDRSGSMHKAIDLAQRTAGLIAKQVKGRVFLIFFNYAPNTYDVTGMSYEKIMEKTRSIRASGSTSIGVGLDWAMKNEIVVNGIVICSDGGHNTDPFFSYTYKKYMDKFGIEPMVYFFKLDGDHDRFTGECLNAKVGIETFDLRKDVDFYSLPQIIPTLKANRYALIDEVMETPLLRFDDVFKK